MKYYLSLHPNFLLRTFQVFKVEIKALNLTILHSDSFDYAATLWTKHLAACHGHMEWVQDEVEWQTHPGMPQTLCWKHQLINPDVILISHGLYRQTESPHKNQGYNSLNRRLNRSGYETSWCWQVWTLRCEGTSKRKIRFVTKSAEVLSVLMVKNTLGKETKITAVYSSGKAISGAQEYKV